MEQTVNTRVRVGRPVTGWLQSRSVRAFVLKTITYVLLVVIAFVMMIPFLWMISSSLKQEYEIFMFPPRWIPSQLMWHNYVTALTKFPFIRSARNTVLITGSCIVGTLLSTSMPAMAFARLRFRARGALFVLVLSTMMVPYHVTLIPQYIAFNLMGWVNSFKPLIVPAFFGVAAYDIFLLRQFFMTIPLELDDAARIDGCNTLDIYWRIILPLSRPALITVAIFQFMAGWNSFLAPLIYLDDTEKHTLAIALARYRFGGNYMPARTWSGLMVVSLATMLPCLIVFFLAQRVFIQGIVISGVEG